MGVVKRRRRRSVDRITLIIIITIYLASCWLGNVVVVAMMAKSISNAMMTKGSHETSCVVSKREG